MIVSHKAKKSTDVYVQPPSGLFVRIAQLKNLLSQSTNYYRPCSYVFSNGFSQLYIFTWPDVRIIVLHSYVCMICI